MGFAKRRSTHPTKRFMLMRLELLIVKVFAVKKGGYLVALFYLTASIS